MPSLTRLSASLSTAALTAGLGLPLAAQELLSGEGTFLGTIRIDSREAQAVLGNAEITEEEIEQRNASAIRDVFSGVSAVQSSGGLRSPPISSLTGSRRACSP